MEAVVISVAITITGAILLWVGSLIKNTVKKSFTTYFTELIESVIDRKVNPPIKEMNKEIKILRSESTIIDNYLMERNGYGDYKKKAKEEEKLELEIESLIEGKS